MKFLSDLNARFPGLRFLASLAVLGGGLAAAPARAQTAPSGPATQNPVAVTLDRLQMCSGARTVWKLTMANVLRLTGDTMGEKKYMAYVNQILATDGNGWTLGPLPGNPGSLTLVKQHLDLKNPFDVGVARASEANLQIVKSVPAFANLPLAVRADMLTTGYNKDPFLGDCDGSEKTFEAVSAAVNARRNLSAHP